MRRLRFIRVVRAITLVLLATNSVLIFAQSNIERVDLPILRGHSPLAISSDASFAITHGPLGSLSRLDLATGAMNDLPTKLSNRLRHVALIPGSDLLACVDESRHSVVLVDTRKAENVAVIPLPEHSVMVEASRVVKKLENANPRLNPVPLKDVTATGLWVSRTGSTLAIAFGSALVVVDVPSKSSSTIPPLAVGGLILQAAFSCDSSAMVFSAEGGLRGMAVVDLTTHDRIFDIDGFELQRGRIPATAGAYYSSKHMLCFKIAWSSDDSIVAGIVHEHAGESLRFWNGTTGDLVRTWSRPETTFDAIELSPDGSLCLTVAETWKEKKLVATEVLLIETKSGVELSTMQLPLSQLEATESGHGRIYLFNGVDTAFIVSIKSVEGQPSGGDRRR